MGRAIILLFIPLTFVHLIMTWDFDWFLFIQVASYNAPFFTTWFITNWTVLFFPIYFFVSLLMPNRNSAGTIIGESVRNFREKGFTAGTLIVLILSFIIRKSVSGRFFMRCSFFCTLWVSTNYMYVYSLKSLLATDVMALFATNVSSVYLLSWVILHEQFVGVRVNQISLISRKKLTLFWRLSRWFFATRELHFLRTWTG